MRRLLAFCCTFAVRTASVLPQEAAVHSEPPTPPIARPLLQTPPGASDMRHAMTFRIIGGRLIIEDASNLEIWSIPPAVGPAAPPSARPKPTEELGNYLIIMKTLCGENRLPCERPGLGFEKAGQDAADNARRAKQKAERP